MTRLVLIDNHDSFVYNLVDAVRALGFDTIVYRNTVDVDTVFHVKPDAIVLSPGPGYPADAGVMPELIAKSFSQIPLLGICLGFQAMIEHLGATVRPCGPVHGQTDLMTLTDAGVASGLFDGMPVDSEPDHPDEPGRLVPVARYHSLGLPLTETPDGFTALATASSTIGDVVMAGWCADGMALGVQYHPESILTPDGPIMLERFISQLLKGKSPHDNR